MLDIIVTRAHTLRTKREAGDQRNESVDRQGEVQTNVEDTVETEVEKEEAEVSRAHTMTKKKRVVKKRRGRKVREPKPIKGRDLIACKNGRREEKCNGKRKREKREKRKNVNEAAEGECEDAKTLAIQTEQGNRPADEKEHVLLQRGKIDALRESESEFSSKSGESITSISVESTNIDKDPISDMEKENMCKSGPLLLRASRKLARGKVLLLFHSIDKSLLTVTNCHCHTFCVNDYHAPPYSP